MRAEASANFALRRSGAFRRSRTRQGSGMLDCLKAANAATPAGIGRRETGIAGFVAGRVKSPMRWLSPLLLVLAAPAFAADVAVVCPEGLRDALRPWVEHRTKQGYSVQFFSARG